MSGVIATLFMGMALSMWALWFSPGSPPKRTRREVGFTMLMVTFAMMLGVAVGTDNEQRRNCGTEAAGEVKQ